MKLSGKPWVVPFFLMLGLGLAYYYWNRPKVTSDQARSLATWGLADYLARNYPGSRVLVVSNPYAHKDGVSSFVVDQETSGIRGLKQGFRDKIELVRVVYPALKPEAEKDPRSIPIAPDVTTPLSYLVTEDSFDQLWQQNQEGDLIVSLIGLPANLTPVQCWQRTGLPRFALLLPDLDVMGGVEAVSKAFASGKLLAFVGLKTGFFEDSSISEAKRAEEFQKRFILVTAENFEALVREHPDYLGLDKPSKR